MPESMSAEYTIHERVDVPLTVTVEVPFPLVILEGQEVECDNACHCTPRCRSAEFCWPIYYRPMLGHGSGDTRYVAMCLQRFDEHDYEPGEFLNAVRYRDKETCEAVCGIVNAMFGHDGGCGLIGKVPSSVLYPMVQNAMQIARGREEAWKQR